MPGNTNNRQVDVVDPGGKKQESHLNCTDNILYCMSDNSSFINCWAGLHH